MPAFRLKIHQTYNPCCVRLRSLPSKLCTRPYWNMKVASRLIKATNFHHNKVTISPLLISEGWTGETCKFSKWYWVVRLTLSPTSTTNFMFMFLLIILPISPSSNSLLFQIQWYFVYHWTQLLDPSNKTRIFVIQNTAICRRTYFGST
jgi:hypothetical protein